MKHLEILESYIPIAKFIAAMSGPRCEVSIHNLQDMDHSIIFIENGELTGRKVGDTILNFDVHTMLEAKNMRKPYLANYAGKHTVGNRIFRFSTYYIRDEAGKVIGLLNANVDITDLLAMQETIAKELFFSYDSYSDFRQVLPDAMAVSSESVINDFIENALTTLGYMDIQKLKKDDKMRIVSYLNELNAFSLKGAVEIVAKRLCVSVPTIYRYRNNL